MVSIKVIWQDQLTKNIENIVKKENISYEQFFKQHPKGKEKVANWKKLISKVNDVDEKDEKIILFLVECQIERKRDLNL